MRKPREENVELREWMESIEPRRAYPTRLGAVIPEREEPIGRGYDISKCVPMRGSERGGPLDFETTSGRARPLQDNVVCADSKALQDQRTDWHGETRTKPLPNSEEVIGRRKGNTVAG